MQRHVLLCSVLALAASSCSSTTPTPASDAGSGSGAGEASDPIAKPCSYFTEEIAALVVAGPFQAPKELAGGSASTCSRTSTAGSVLARFERGSGKDSVKRQCGAGPEVPGLGQFACQIGNDPAASITMLTTNGDWNLLMSASPVEKVKPALLKLEEKLK